MIILACILFYALGVKGSKNFEKENIVFYYENLIYVSDPYRQQLP